MSSVIRRQCPVLLDAMSSFIGMHSTDGRGDKPEYSFGTFYRIHLIEIGLIPSDYFEPFK